MKPSPFLLVPHKGGKLTLDTRLVAAAFSDERYLHIALTVGRSPTLEMGGDAQAAADAATALVDAIHSLQEHYGPTPQEQPQLTTVLPPLPPGEEWHNPENVPVSLLPSGHRFMLKSEIQDRAEQPEIRMWLNDLGRFNDGKSIGNYFGATYAVPLATWPLPRP